MKLKVVSLETAKKLYESGIDIESNSGYYLTVNGDSALSLISNIRSIKKNNPYYKPIYYAPTLALVQMYLLENHSINIFLEFEKSHENSMEIPWIKYKYRIWHGTVCINKHMSNRKDSHNEALESGILEALNLIKK